MTEPTDPKPELEVKSDSDWKQRVKAEAAQLDAEISEEQPAETATVAPEPDAEDESPSISDMDVSQLPPPDFMALVSMFSTQAMVSLGLVPNPASGKAESNLGLARHFIDLLGILDEKTRGNLTGDESQLLEQSLHELRMAYVEMSRSAGP